MSTAPVGDPSGLPSVTVVSTIDAFGLPTKTLCCTRPASRFSELPCVTTARRVKMVELHARAKLNRADATLVRVCCGRGVSGWAAVGALCCARSGLDIAGALRGVPGTASTTLTLLTVCGHRVLRQRRGIGSGRSPGSHGGGSHPPQQVLASLIIHPSSMLPLLRDLPIVREVERVSLRNAGQTRLWWSNHGSEQAGERSQWRSRSRRNLR